MLKFIGGLVTGVIFVTVLAVGAVAASQVSRDEYGRAITR